MELYHIPKATAARAGCAGGSKTLPARCDLSRRSAAAHRDEWLDTADAATRRNALLQLYCHPREACPCESREQGPKSVSKKFIKKTVLICVNPCLKTKLVPAKAGNGQFELGN